jgi:hypothetical protein
LHDPAGKPSVPHGRVALFVIEQWLKREVRMARETDFLSSGRSWALRRWRSSWIVRYAVGSVALSLLFGTVFADLLGLPGAGHVRIAAILGFLGVIGAGVALMGATFYSSRSGIDDSVGDLHTVNDVAEKPDHVERDHS